MAAREVIALADSNADPGAQMPSCTADDRRYLSALTRCTACNARPDAPPESTHILWLCRVKNGLPHLLKKGSLWLARSSVSGSNARGISAIGRETFRSEEGFMRTRHSRFSKDSISHPTAVVLLRLLFWFPLRLPSIQ